MNSSSFRSTRLRRLGIRWLSMAIRLCAGYKICDPTSGFRAANQEVCKYFAKSYPVDYPEPESLVELLKHSFRIQEVSINMKDRVGGSSSIHAWKSIYYMIKVTLAIVCTSLQRQR